MQFQTRGTVYFSNYSMLYYGILTPIEYHGSLVTRRMPIAPKVGEPVLIGLFRLLCLQIDVTSSATSSSSACAACCNSLLRLRHIMCFLLRLLLCVVIPLRPACPARRRIRGLLRGKLPSPPAWTFLAPQSASISYPSTEIVNEAMAYSMSTPKMRRGGAPLLHVLPRPLFHVQQQS